MGGASWTASLQARLVANRPELKHLIRGADLSAALGAEVMEIAARDDAISRRQLMRR